MTGSCSHGYSAGAVREEYSARQQNLEAVAASSSRRSKRAIATCAACVVVLVLSILLRTDVHTPVAAAFLILLLTALWQIRIFLRHRRWAIDAAHRAAFYERGINRIDGGWPGKGNAGTEFVRDHHPYQGDLDILGKGSLFELLATTRSDAGAERLMALQLGEGSGLLPLAVTQNPCHRQRGVVIENPRGNAAKIGERTNMAFQKCFRGFGGKGHHEAVVGVRQVEGKIVRLALHAGDHD